MNARPDTQPTEYYDENGNRWERRTIKRHCNGCDQPIGDATDAELEAGFNGLPQQDVRSECPTCTPAAGGAR